MVLSSINKITPHPDEIAEGHLGRIAILKGFESQKSCLEHLVSELKENKHFDPTMTTVEVLSAFSGKNLHRYMKLHTLLPFTCFAGNDKKRTKTGSWTRDAQKNDGLRRLRNGAYFCSECVQEDVQFLGYSYWRRTHQLPGVFWCDKHPEVCLQEVATDNPFGRLPQNWINDSATRKYTISPEIKHHPLVIRFNFFCRKMLNSNKSYDILRVRPPMSFLARVAGLQVENSSVGLKYPYFSDLIARIFPKEWLDSVAPNCFKKAYGERYPKIDSALVPGLMSFHLLGTAFGMTLMFGSMSIALTFISSDTSDINTRPIKMTRREFAGLVNFFKSSPKCSLDKYL